MRHEEVLEKLQARFPGAAVLHVEGLDYTLAVPAAYIAEVAAFLRDSCGFDFLSNLSGVDYPDRFEVVYHLYSTRDPQPPLVLKVALPDKTQPRLSSVVGVWRGAELQEREAYDMFGIVFEGHPKLERILMWDGYPGYPLRKDFENQTQSFDDVRRTLPPEEER